MSLRRPIVPKSEEAATKAPTAPVFEFDLVPVTKLQCVLDNGLPLEFNLDAKLKHSYKETPKWLVVTLGTRVIRIAAPRILYFETSPGEEKRRKNVVTTEQLVALVTPQA